MSSQLDELHAKVTLVGLTAGVLCWLVGCGVMPLVAVTLTSLAAKKVIRDVLGPDIASDAAGR